MLPQTLRGDTMDGLVFALLDTAAAIPDAALAARLRDLTISWSRFKYSGPILEGADLDALLGRAATATAWYRPGDTSSRRCGRRKGAAATS
jgi:hypothetical protein